MWKVHVKASYLPKIRTGMASTWLGHGTSVNVATYFFGYV